MAFAFHLWSMLAGLILGVIFGPRLRSAAGRITRHD